MTLESSPFKYFICHIPASTSTSPLHLRQEEKILASIHREGDVDHFEVRGLLCLHVTDQELATVQINVDNSDERQIQIQV